MDKFQLKLATREFTLGKPTWFLKILSSHMLNEMSLEILKTTDCRRKKTILKVSAAE